MWQRNTGKMLCLALAFSLSGCRTDQPPKLSIICIGDGFGGADCVENGGARTYKSPTDLKNYWMTTETDQANFSSWCYGGDVRPAMNEIKEAAQ